MQVRIDNALLTRALTLLMHDLNTQASGMMQSPMEMLSGRSFRSTSERLDAIATEATKITQDIAKTEEALQLLRQNKVCTVFRSDIETLRQQIPRTEDMGR